MKEDLDKIRDKYSTLKSESKKLKSDNLNYKNDYSNV